MSFTYWIYKSLYTKKPYHMNENNKNDSNINLM